MRSVIPEKIHPVIAAIHKVGGRPLLVGGAVRDYLLNKNTEVMIKDLDFEVYHISIKALIRVLSDFGRVETVGSSFAVIKLFMSRELDIDFALPRRESKKGRGHRGFVISADPDMPPEEACARRDFTINAMLMDPLDGTIYDYFGGRDDLENRILRHTSDHFDEDPLRPLRAMQFAARFGMRLDDGTAAQCRSLKTEALSLAEERIFGEWEKWALYATLPSRGLDVLAEIGWDPLFGDLTALKQQNGVVGDGWADTRFAVDRAAALADQAQMGRNDRLVLMLGALTHALSEEVSAAFLQRLGTPNSLVKRLLPLLGGIRGVRPGATVDDALLMHLSVRLAPEAIRSWAALRSCLPGSPSDTDMARLLARAEALGIADARPAPLVTGKLLVEKGIAPGPVLGRILNAAFEAQLDRQISTQNEAEQWVTHYLATRGVNS